MVVVPDGAMAQSDGDALPGAHAPADDAYVIVALTSLVVAVTTAAVVPAGAAAVYDVVVLTNAGDSSPGSMSSSPSDASLDAPAGATVTTIV
jgi:hypothetical protein